MVPRLFWRGTVVIPIERPTVTARQRHGNPSGCGAPEA
jgi:hypothetical protein